MSLTIRYFNRVRIIQLWICSTIRSPTASDFVFLAYDMRFPSFLLCFYNLKLENIVISKRFFIMTIIFNANTVYWVSSDLIQKTQIYFCAIPRLKVWITTIFARGICQLVGNVKRYAYMKIFLWWVFLRKIENIDFLNEWGI